MNQKSFFLFLITLLIFSSCNGKYYDYNANYDGDKLVVNGTIEANIGVTISLSKSQSPAGIITLQELSVKNGRVWLYQNDTLVAEMTLNTKKKYTINNFKPQAGKAYHIKAVADNLDTVESLSVIIPQAPLVNSFKFKKDNTYAVNSNKEAVLFSVDIKDEVNEKNFYLLDSYIQIRSDSIDQNYLGFFLHDYESCEFDGGTLTSFTDKCFNGGDFTLDYVSEHEKKGTLQVKFSAIDKNFFNYLHNWEQPTGLELGFAEPKLIVSNIKNGYGMLVAKNTLSFSLKLD